MSLDHANRAELRARGFRSGRYRMPARATSRRLAAASFRTHVVARNERGVLIRQLRTDDAAGRAER